MNMKVLLTLTWVSFKAKLSVWHFLNSSHQFPSLPTVTSQNLHAPFFISYASGLRVQNAWIGRESVTSTSVPDLSWLSWPIMTLLTFHDSDCCLSWNYVCQLPKQSRQTGQFKHHARKNQNKSLTRGRQLYKLGCLSVCLSVEQPSERVQFPKPRFRSGSALEGRSGKS